MTTVTEARVLDVISRLKDAVDSYPKRSPVVLVGREPAPTDDELLLQDARECLAYLHGAVLRHGPGFVVQADEEQEDFANSVRAGEPDFLPGHETVTFPAKETFTVHDGEEARASSVKDACADAAQEAEHLHAETGRPHVVRGPDCEVWYTSRGTPED